MSEKRDDTLNPTIKESSMASDVRQRGTSIEPASPDLFEPTIEESVMASGLHQQGSSPTMTASAVARTRPRLQLSLPAETDFDLQEVNGAIAGLADRLGGEVDVQFEFTVKPRRP